MRRFLIFSLGLCAIYFGSLFSLEVFYSGVHIKSFDFFPVFFPVLVGYLIHDWKGNDAVKQWDWRHADARWASLFLLSVMGMLLSQWFLFRQVNSLYLVLFYVSYLVAVGAWFLLLYPANFFRIYRKQLVLFYVVFVLGVVAFMGLVFNWSLMAETIVLVLGNALAIFIPDLVVLHDHMSLGLNGYSAFVGLPCTGITSLLLFVSVMGALGVSLHSKKELNVLNYFIVSGVGLIFTVLLNLLRIALIFLVGAYYSPELAGILIHNVAGVILFALFIVLFLKISIPFLRQKSRHE